MLNSDEMERLIEFLGNFNRYTGAAFAAGIEERDYGSYRRQEKLVNRVRESEKKAKELHQLLKTRLNNFTYNGDFS